MIYDPKKWPAVPRMTEATKEKLKVIERELELRKQEAILKLVLGDQDQEDLRNYKSTKPEPTPEELDKVFHQAIREELLARLRESVDPYWMKDIEKANPATAQLDVDDFEIEDVEREYQGILEFTRRIYTAPLNNQETKMWNHISAWLRMRQAWDHQEISKLKERLHKAPFGYKRFYNHLTEDKQITSK